MNGPPDWTTCVQNLSASTSTARKARAASREGAKQALSQLDADRLGQLDAAARRRAGAERGSATWPLLIKAVMSYVTQELAAAQGRKTPLAPAVSSLFRKCLRKAEDANRVAALGHVLLPRADKIFAHIAEAMCASTATPQLVSDYTAALRETLLPVPAYCLKAAPDTYSNVLDVYMSRLMARHKLPCSADESFRSASALAELLRRCPHSLSQPTWEDCLDFSVDMCGEATADGGGMLGADAADARTQHAVLSAINALLLRWGADVAYEARQLAAALVPVMMRAWSGPAAAGNRKFKDECFAAARTLLRVQLLPGVPGALRATLAAAQAEVERRAGDAMRAHVESRAVRVPPLADAHEWRHLLELIAELWAHRARGAPGWEEEASAAEEDEDEDFAAPRKRARKQEPWAAVLEAACGGGQALLPALALTLRRHGRALPASACAAALQPLWACVAASLAGERPPGPLEAVGTVWALRCLRELAALVSPLQEGASAGNAAPADVASPCWPELSEHLLRWTISSGDGGVLSAEVLQTAAAIVARGLAPPPRAPEQLIGLPHLLSPNRLALVTMAAFASRPAGSCAGMLSDAESGMRRRSVGWALNALAPLPMEQIAMNGPRRSEEAPDVRGVADLLRALCLGTPPPAAAVDAVASWWEEDALEPALRLLHRSLDAADVADAASSAIAAPPAIPPLQPPRMALPVAKDLLAHAGRMLAEVLDSARDAAHVFALQAVTAELGLASEAALATDAVPSEWCSNGVVAAASPRALERAQSALMERAPPARLFTPRLLAAAHALGSVAALKQPGPAAGDDSLGTTVLQLRHAVLAGARALRDAAATQASTAVEDDLFFDDDELGAAAAAAPAPRAAAATQRVSTLATAATTQAAGAPGLTMEGDGPLEHCVGVIAALGIARPSAAADVLLSLLKEVQARGDAVPPAVGDAVLAALCGLQGAPVAVTAAAMDALGVAINEASGVDPDRALWLLRLVAMVAAVVRQSKPPAPPEDAEMLDAEGGTPAGAAVLRAAHQQLCDRLCGPACATLHGCGLAAAVALVNAVCSLLCAVHNAPECLTGLASQLVRDTRYAVRHAMATCFAELVASFPVHVHVYILADVRPSLAGLTPPPADENGALAPVVLTEEESQSRPRQETALLLLGEVAVASAPLEAACIYDIVDLAVAEPYHVPVALQVLTGVAQRLGYPDRFGLMHQHIPQIAHRWACSGRNINSMINASDLLAPHADMATGSDLIKAYARYLLPRLVECNDGSSVNDIAKLCSLDSRQLFTQHGARTLAALHALRANGGEAGRHTFTACFGSPTAVMPLAMGGANEVLALYKIRAVGVLRSLLTMVREGDDMHSQMTSVRPSLTADETLKAISDLESVMGVREPSQVLSTLWSGEKVAQHLQEVHDIIGRAKSPRHLATALASLSVLLRALEKHKVLAVPSTFRYAVHLLLSLVATPSLQALAIRLLARLVDGTLAHGATGTAAAALGDVLWRCVSRLVACAQAAPGAPPPDVMQLLHKLVVEAPPWLRPRVAELDSFPEDECFAPLRVAHEALSADVPLAARLSRFCERARGLLPGPRRTAAAALLAALRSPGAAAAADAAPVAPAVWRLAQLCEQVDDDTLRELAAAALAFVGPADPFAVAFHAGNSSAAIAGADLAASAGTASGASRRRSGAPPAENECLAGVALRALAGYLVDDDDHIVRAAQLATHALLRTSAGGAALAALPELERTYLSVFAPARNDPPVDPPSTPADAGAPLDDDALWAPPPPASLLGAAYDAWLCRLAHALLCHARGVTLRICRDLAGRKAELAALLLPFAFEDIAAGAGAGAAGAPLRQVLSDKAKAHVLLNGAAGARATHVLLECLAFLRAARVRAGLRGLPTNPENRPAAGTAGRDDADPATWVTVHWLDVDYLCAARAALRCGACFTALQYVEYWCEDAYRALTLGNVDALNDAGPLPGHIMAALEAHELCGESDGIYGMLRAPHVALQMHRAEHESAWGRSLAAHDAVLRIGGSGATSAATAAGGVLRSLQRLGCPFVLDAVASKLCAAAGDGVPPAFREAQMEAAWRAGRWDVAADGEAAPTPSQQLGAADGFHACFAGALRATQAGELSQCSSLLSRGRASVMRGIALTGAESAASINTAIVRLQLLDEVSDAAHARWSSAAAVAAGGLEEAVSTELSRRWADAHTAHLGGRFDLLEPLLAGRAAVMHAVGSAAGAAQALTAAAAAARTSGFAGAGLARIHEIKIACAKGAGLGGAHAVAAASVAAAGAAWRDEEAALLWADGQYELALGLARALVDAPSAGAGLPDTLRRASLLSTLGGWLAERRDESTARISDKFEQAVELLTHAQTAQRRAQPALSDALCRAQFQLAQFLDSVQRGLEERMTSPEWKQSLLLRESMSAEATLQAQKLSAQRSKSTPRDAAAQAKKKALEDELSKRIGLLKRHLAADDAARKQTQSQHTAALMGCLSAYAECLASGDCHDTTALFRLVALWFKHAHLPDVNARMAALLAASRPDDGAAVPSAKVLPLVWQLSARLEPGDAGATGFQPALHALVARAARDHPFHALYQLMALRAAGTVGDAQLVSAPVSKVAAAQSQLDGARASSPRLAAIMAQMEALVDVYVKIALAPADKNLSTMQLPSDARRLKAQALVPLITLHLDVDPTCTYSNFVSLVEFSGSAQLLGGVNLPRRVTVLGSDGRTYSQLAKSRDDLRQDAVMQQVFGHASALLRGAPGARARGLRMHTYKVVPFSPLAGLVEWCEDTVVLSDWLVYGASPAHTRLRPQDMSVKDARTKMTNSGGDARTLRAAYDAVCARFKPVLHHFFLESFPSAPLWYERRLAYTRSVAVSSMVGHVIGLGDRHCSNILIGRTSAELTHIDLGIAFEQGKLLQTPETVPFRLTQDIVDGCGAAGVEGVLRRCCEETLAILRANKESLLTLIEVLIHDPILKWAMTPEKARRFQRHREDDEAAGAGAGGTEAEAPPESAAHAREAEANVAADAAGVQNADAERALLRVRQKLDGTEDGELRSVEGQVQQLLQDARDPDKLCRLYPGWAAWV